MWKDEGKKCRKDYSRICSLWSWYRKLLTVFLCSVFLVSDVIVPRGISFCQLFVTVIFYLEMIIATVDLFVIRNPNLEMKSRWQLWLRSKVGRVIYRKCQAHSHLKRQVMMSDLFVWPNNYWRATFPPKHSWGDFLLVLFVASLTDAQ